MVRVHSPPLGIVLSPASSPGPSPRGVLHGGRGWGDAYAALRAALSHGRSCSSSSLSRSSSYHLTLMRGVEMSHPSRSPLMIVPDAAVHPDRRLRPSPPRVGPTLTPTNIRRFILDGGRHRRWLSPPRGAHGVTRHLMGGMNHTVDRRVSGRRGGGVSGGGG